MSDKPNGIQRRKVLREKAQELVKFAIPFNPTALEIILHELMVHKVELEMQNEELQRSQITMEESRDRYLDFYEFAPVGYITLTRDGLIREINLTGCAMLGVDRFRIMSRRFSSYISQLDQDRWHRLFIRTMQHSDIQKQAFDLKLIRADGSILSAYLNCVKCNLSDSSSDLRIALTDISQLKNV
jgi:PAS domain S-box-containing protein